MDDTVRSTTSIARVKVIKQTSDPYDGLKGHDYINARKLAQPVQRMVQTSASSKAIKADEAAK